MSTRTSAARCGGGRVRIAASTSSLESVLAELSTPCRGSGTGRSSGSPDQETDRADRRRSRSSEALTTIRCSQVVTADSPRKSPARRKAEIIASWRASAASSGSQTMRRATAHSRSLWRRNSAPKASWSPARCRRSNSASDAPPTVIAPLGPDPRFPGPDAPVPPSEATAARSRPAPPLACRGDRGPAYHDVVDETLVDRLSLGLVDGGGGRVHHLRQAGQPDQDVLAG